MQSPEKIHLARQFRREPTKSEKILWQALRRKNFLGFKFRRQHVVEGYIIDLYCHKLKLAVEIDGQVHIQTAEDDQYRPQILERKGLIFFRISVQEVEEKLDEVLKNLESWILTSNATVLIN